VESGRCKSTIVIEKLNSEKTNGNGSAEGMTVEEGIDQSYEKEK
jgi:hypothetical protein